MEPNLVTKILRTLAPESDVIVDGKNPLLDRNTCAALAAGLVRLLKIAFTTAPRARTALLQNIRALTAAPRNHRHADIIPILTQYYATFATDHKEHDCDNTERELTKFLVLQIDNLHIEITLQDSKADLARALLNIDARNPFIEYELKHILSHNFHNDTMKKFLHEIWEQELITDTNLLDSLSKAVRSKIERVLLESACNIISDTNASPQYILELKEIKNLIEKSSQSSECFRICCHVLNFILKYSHFNSEILKFIQIFIDSLKYNKDLCSYYEDEMQGTVMLLNCCNLQSGEDETLIKIIVDNLMVLRASNLDYFIMLLSHYQQWFDYIFQAESC